MLQLVVPKAPASELWDEDRCEFVPQPSFEGATIQLEHSLIAISKWESKYHKSFSSTKEKTPEEMLDYIRCMTLTKNVDPEVYAHLTPENCGQVKAYIEDSMTATVIHRRPGKGKGRGPSPKIITSEQIYSWMIDCEIPWAAEKWHLNRLMMLIEIRQLASDPGPKMSKKSIMKSNAALNAARRGKMHSKG